MNDEAIIIACDEIVPEKIGKEKLNLYQLWHEDTYPDDYSLCKIASCLARKCHELHSKRKRTTDKEWMQFFKVEAKSGLKKCPICQRRLFVGRSVCPWYK